MLAKIAGIALVSLLALALVGGSAYVLLRSSEGPTLRVAHGPGGPDHRDAHGEAEGSRQGHGRGSGPECDGEEHPAEAWTTVTGTVVGLEPELVLQTEEGEVVVHLGPEWYRDAQGLALEVGDQVAVTGFFEHDGLEAAQVDNLTTGQSLTLRTETGQPLWAGHGRRGR